MGAVISMLTLVLAAKYLLRGRIDVNVAPRSTRGVVAGAARAAHKVVPLKGRALNSGYHLPFLFFITRGERVCRKRYWPLWGAAHGKEAPIA